VIFLLTLSAFSGKLYPVSERKTMIQNTVMKTKFILTWHDLDADRINESEFENKKGKDHFGLMNALHLAQVIDANAWPWKVEKILPEGGRELSSHNWGGEKLQKSNI